MAGCNWATSDHSGWLAEHVNAQSECRNSRKAVPPCVKQQPALGAAIVPSQLLCRAFQHMRLLVTSCSLVASSVKSHSRPGVCGWIDLVGLSKQSVGCLQVSVNFLRWQAFSGNEKREINVHPANEARADPESVVEVFPDLMSSPPLEESDSPPLSPTGIRSRARKHLTKQIGEAADAWHKGPFYSQDDENILQTHELGELIYISCEKPSDMRAAPVNGQLVPGDRSIMANISEPQLRKFVKGNPGSLIEYCKNNLGRMYPFGLRFDSSNADPYLAWVHGFQIAALNTQGRDRPCWIARAMFDGNGRCGFVKKPHVLLPGSELTFDQIFTMAPKLQLKIKVLMGTDWHKLFDLFKRPDFYVKLVLHGMPADVDKKRTDTIYRSNEPNWENQTFEFLIRVPEIAVLRIEVWEHDRLQRDDFVGQACFPVKEIRNGIRSVRLNCRDGDPLDSKLLCWIEKQELPG
ncbi:hypothetical protein L7F22_010238 [Adiantum nelumboides]|nr:hypothetical protein [Adiantum nelumboides]